MGRLRNRCLAVSAAAAAVALSLGATTARAADPSYDELKQQVDQLKARLDQIETKQADQVTAQDVDATITSVLKDADQRSQMLQMEGFTAGYNKGRFTIQDAAGNWVFRPTFQFQIRTTTNWQNEGKHGGSSSDTSHGFEIPRMKFGADGNAFTPDLTYRFLWNTKDTDGSFNLEEAWVKYQLNDQFAVRAGQFINPVFHEQSIGSRMQLAVDRSLIDDIITGAGEARTQGVTIQYDDKGPFWAEFGVEDGFNSQNTDFTDPNVTATSNDWGVMGRVNYLIKGPRSEYTQFTALGDKDDLMAVGGGGDITQTGDSTSYLHTVDFQWNTTGGLSLYAAYLGDYVDTNSNNFYNWGFLVQSGYMINDKWEVFGRYDYTKLDSSVVSSGESTDYCDITLGVNWYIWGTQSAKITVDGTYLPNGSPVNFSNADILASQDKEFLLRAQFQLLL